MKEYTVIKSVISQGYWCSASGEFRGVLFATKYESNNPSLEPLSTDLKQAIAIEPCELIRVYS